MRQIGKGTMRTLFMYIFIFFLLAPFIFAVSEDEIRQAIKEDPKLYRIYHNDPEKLIALIEERPQIWDAYLWKKEHPYSFDLHVPEEEKLDFMKRVFLSGVKRGKISIKINDPSSVPSSLKNAKINLKLSDGEIIGITMKDGQIQALQSGALKDYTTMISLSDTAAKAFMQGSVDIQTAVKQNLITAVKPDGTSFDILQKTTKSTAKKKSLTGKAIAVPSGQVSQWFVVLLVLGMILFALYHEKIKKKKFRVRKK